MIERYDLAGPVALGVTESVEESSRRFVASQMDPFPGAPSTADPDVLIDAGPSPAITEIQNPANDGLVTGSDGDALYVRAGDGWCRLPATGRTGGPARFVLSGGFPLWRVFKTVMRPAIQLALLPAGAVAVHSASVEFEGAGIVVAGWSESGKTETALALMESGASFLSDKWTVWDAGAQLSAFPIGVGIRRWVLPYLPRLRGSLTRAARAQFAAAGAADRATRPLRGGRRGGRLAGLAGEAMDRAVALADRAALTPTELRAAYGQTDDPARRVRAGCIVLLANVATDEVSVQETDPAVAAARLARSGAYERRVWFALQERARFALPAAAAGPTMEEVVERERALLGPLLASTRILTVRAPFPTDPRRVASAIRDRL
ncbi:MAG: hypothetical protein QOF69_4072 [Solirubrobacteraceae bacterium]|nr:hypothetical protein [Solirubrobacteraceae bacterium]